MKKVFAIGFLLLGAFTCFAQSIPTTESILSTAYKQAAKENKNVFVIFHASWCGWCKKMDASMNDALTKKYFNDNYVTVHLTVLETPQNKLIETPGADEYLKKIKKEIKSLPFFVILNNDGSLLGDSFIDGSNIGCPASDNEVAGFSSLLKKTSKINAEGLKIIAARFKQNSVQQ